MGLTMNNCREQQRDFGDPYELGCKGMVRRNSNAQTTGRKVDSLVQLRELHSTRLCV